MNIESLKKINTHFKQLPDLFQKLLYLNNNLDPSGGINSKFDFKVHTTSVFISVLHKKNGNRLRVECCSNKRFFHFSRLNFSKFKVQPNFFRSLNRLFLWTLYQNLQTIVRFCTWNTIIQNMVPEPFIHNNICFVRSLWSFSKVRTKDPYGSLISKSGVKM